MYVSRNVRAHCTWSGMRPGWELVSKKSRTAAKSWWCGSPNGCLDDGAGASAPSDRGWFCRQFATATL